MRPTGLKGRKGEKTPGEWRERWTGFSICSYPPEDLVIENYGHFLKKKGKSILSEERSHTEPFTTSLLDGIDLRETLRNWHEKKIYVRSWQRVSGEVGAVVLIFDEDRDNRYSYCKTWLGEHQNESDHGLLRHRAVREYRRPRHRPLRIRWASPQPSLSPHDGGLD